jgi:ATP-binding cassette subfamily B protein/subfamily B ATP-binding cassette protein MsbA
MKKNPSVAQFAARFALLQWRGMSALGIIMLIEIALGVLTPWPMKWLVDNALGSAPAPAFLHGMSKQSMLLFCVGSTVSLFAASALLGLVQSIISINVGQGLTFGVSSDLFAHLQRLSLRFHSRQSVGDSIRRVVSDCGCVTTIVRDCALPMAASVITLLVMAAISFAISWQLTLLSLIIMPLMLPLFWRYGNAIADRSYEYGECESRAYERIERALSAVPVMQAFSRETANDLDLERTYTATLSAAIRSNFAQMKLSFSTGLLTAIGSAAILCFGAMLVLNHQLTVGSLLIFLSYLASIYSPLDSIVDSSRHVLDAAGSARRVLEVLSMDQDVVEAPNAKPLKITSRNGCRLHLQDITFGYQPDRPVLKNISLSVSPGEIVALVGGSGAGKTTLVSLLPRLYDPWSGQVLIDDQNAREVQLSSLRQQIGLVLQQSFLFPISIAENIAYGLPGASQRQIEDAARAAAAHDFIRALPDGFNTVVGERGATLSVGQRQRISIARALLKNPPLLVLDEPTSALDAETESTFVDAMRAAGAGRTTLVIAHKLSTVRAADRIAVLENGVISGTGTHEQLLAISPHYAELCRHQMTTEPGRVAPEMQDRADTARL